MGTGDVEPITGEEKMTDGRGDIGLLVGAVTGRGNPFGGERHAEKMRRRAFAEGSTLIGG